MKLAAPRGCAPRNDCARPCTWRPARRRRAELRARRKPEASDLYQIVQQELETFFASTAARERPVPRFVARELCAFLRCGILAHGFLRVHCDACGLARVVAFSCKGRGFCPSCGGRRMADTAAHLVDRVLPGVPVRQWVLSLPFALRFHPFLPPDDTDVERVARQVARRVARLLERRRLGDDASAEHDTLATQEPLLASLYAASITSRVATGSRSG